MRLRGKNWKKKGKIGVLKRSGRSHSLSGLHAPRMGLARGFTCARVAHALIKKFDFFLFLFFLEKEKLSLKALFRSLA